MSVEQVETLIIGGGQAGLSVSAQLSRLGRSHLVLERHRVAERWRTERWDGFHANSNAADSALPGLAFGGVDPDLFPTGDEMAAYFSAYAVAMAVPIRCGVAVTALRRHDDGLGFHAETSGGTIEATNVVVATGPFQRPTSPVMVPPEAGIFQVHANAYRNPGLLPAGAVLVAGAGASGAQIAEDLSRAGRQVYLAMGSHVRPPRRYRTKDCVWWMDVLGIWDVPTSTPAPKHVPLPLSGTRGGYTIDFRRFAANGIVLLGRATSYRDGVMHFADDLARNLAQGDASYLSILDRADAYVTREGLDLPEEPAARVMEPDPVCVTDPIHQLHLHDAKISTIVWATGFTYDYSWLHIPVLNEQGAPVHHHGVTDIPGLYFLGLDWLTRRRSAFIFGVARDATLLAEQIATRT